MRFNNRNEIFKKLPKLENFIDIANKQAKNFSSYFTASFFFSMKRAQIYVNFT